MVWYNILGSGEKTSFVSRIKLLAYPKIPNSVPPLAHHHALAPSGDLNGLKVIDNNRELKFFICPPDLEGI